MNCCINWINTNSGFLMCLITAVYVVATLLIMHFNKKSANAVKDQAETATKQIDEMKRQQQQNVGISFYSLRKAVLTGFIEEKYNVIYWDAAILFSNEVADAILETGDIYEQLKTKRWLLEEFENRMKTDKPQRYDEYKYYSDLADENEDDKMIQEKLYSLCDGYKPIYEGPLALNSITLDYRELSKGIEKLQSKYEVKKVKTLILIKNELKKSIML